MAQSALYAAILLDELFEALPSPVSVRASDVIGPPTAELLASRTPPQASPIPEHAVLPSQPRERVGVHFGASPLGSTGRVPIGAPVNELQDESEPLIRLQLVVSSQHSSLPERLDDTPWAAEQSVFADIVGKLVRQGILSYRAQWSEPMPDYGTFDWIFQDCVLTVAGIERLQQPCSEEAVGGGREVSIIQALQRRSFYDISDETLARIVEEILGV